MKSGDFKYKMIAAPVGVVYFGLYWYISEELIHFNMFSFPYILLTIYFTVCVVMYPPAAVQMSGTAYKNRLIAPFAQTIAFVFSPVFFLFNIKTGEREEDA